MIDNDRITISNLTYDLVELLDQMWGHDTLEELEAFMATQSPENQHKVRVLQEMLHLSYSDSMVDEMTEYPDAQRLLENILK